jgi:hypothetical protein
MKEKNNNRTEKTKMHKGMFLFYLACAVVLLMAFGVMVFRMMLNAELKEKLDKIRAAGYPTTLAELNDYYPAVPDDENAALLYEKAFKLYHGVVDDEIFKNIGKGSASNSSLKNKQEKSFKDFILFTRNAPLGERLSPKPAFPNREFVSVNKACIQMFKKAAKLPKCRFPIKFNQELYVEYPFLHFVTILIRLSAVDTILAAEVGNSKQAVENILAMLNAARTLNKVPKMISFKASIFREEFAINSLESALILTEFNNQDLIQISDSLKLSLEEQNNALKRTLIVERASKINSDWSKNAKVKIYNIPVPYQFIKLSGIETLNLLKTIDYYNILLSVVDENDSKIAFAQVENYEQNILRVSSIYFMTKLLWLKLIGINDYRISHNAQIRAAITGIAIERYRIKYDKLPEKLSQLVPCFIETIPTDPFTGKPLKYIVGEIEFPIDKDDKNSYKGKYKHSTLVYCHKGPVYCVKRPGYTVYSFGKDGDDDKGIADLNGLGYGDISFRNVRKLNRKVAGD